MNLPKRKLVTIGILAGILSGVAVYFFLAGRNFQSGDFGTRDFIQYWAACRLHSLGQNPFDADAMYALQKEVGLDWHQPVMMWNPPWSLPLICFAMPPDFSAAVRAGLSLNSAIVVMVPFLLASAAKRFSPALLLISLTAMPVLDNLNSGQQGLVLLLAVTAAFLFAASREFFLSGVALSLLALKPYLFGPLWIFVLIWSARTREWKMLAGTAVVIAGLLIAILIEEPAIFEYYSHALKGVDDKGPTTVMQWRPDVLAGDLRALGFLAGLDVWWIMLALPLSGVILTLWYSISVSPGLLNTYPLLIALSLVVTPYGWFSDYCVLLICPLLTELRAADRNTNHILTPNILLHLVSQVSLILCQAFWTTGWYPAFVAVSYYYFNRPSGRKDGATPSSGFTDAL